MPDTTTVEPSAPDTITAEPAVPDTADPVFDELVDGLTFDDDEPEDMFHLVSYRDRNRALEAGTRVRAICGARIWPRRVVPPRADLCPECIRINGGKPFMRGR